MPARWECDNNPLLGIALSDRAYGTGQVAVAGDDDGSVKHVVLCVAQQFNRDVHVGGLLFVGLPGGAAGGATLLLGYIVPFVDLEAGESSQGFQVGVLPYRLVRVVPGSAKTLAVK